MITPVGLLDILAADLDGTFCQQTKGYSKVILAPAEKNDHYFHILNTRYHLMLSAQWDISRCTFAVMGLLNTWTQMSKSRFALSLKMMTSRMWEELMDWSRSQSKVKSSSGIPKISDKTLEFLNTLLAKLPVLLLLPF